MEPSKKKEKHGSRAVGTDKEEAKHFTGNV